MDGWSPSGPRFLGGMEVSVRRSSRVEIKKKNQKTTKRQLTMHTFCSQRQSLHGTKTKRSKNTHISEPSAKECCGIFTQLGPTNHLVVAQLKKSNLLHIKQECLSTKTKYTAVFSYHVTI